MYLIYLLQYNVGIMYYVGTRYIQNSRLLIIISEKMKFAFFIGLYQGTKYKIIYNKV